jgi:hypothetical protein
VYLTAPHFSHGLGLRLFIVDKDGESGQESLALGEFLGLDVIAPGLPITELPLRGGVIHFSRFKGRMLNGVDMLVNIVTMLVNTSFLYTSF